MPMLSWPCATFWLTGLGLGVFAAQSHQDSGLQASTSQELRQMWWTKATMTTDRLASALLEFADIKVSEGRINRFADFLTHLLGTAENGYSLDVVEQVVASQLGGKMSMAEWIQVASRSLEGMRGLETGYCEQLVRSIEQVQRACGLPRDGAAECAFQDAIATDLNGDVVAWDCLMELDDWVFELESISADKNSETRDQMEWCFMFVLSEDERRSLGSVDTCIPIVKRGRMTEYILKQRKVQTAVAAGTALDGAGAHWFLDHGGLLDFIRGGFKSFVDSDIDFAIFHEDLRPHEGDDLAPLERITQSMRAAGFSHEANCSGHVVGGCDRWGRFGADGNLNRIDYLIFHRGRQFM